MHRKLYRLVFSKPLGRTIAFGEIAAPDNTPHGSSPLRSASRGFLRLSLRACSLTSCLIGALAATPVLTIPAWANPNLPEKGQIVSGGGTIGPNTGPDMTIRQDDKKLIINWDKFNIGSGHSVTFRQPDATSIALNRVLGTEASNIAGTLSANGQVFLLNPNGVVFANGAQVNVAGLLASTLSMSDGDFNNGLYRLTSDSKSNGKAVTNAGTLTAAPGGYIALVGDTVKNSGAIATPGGRAALAAGETVTLGISGSSLVSVTVDAQLARKVLLENSGTIKVDNGTIQLTARGANKLLDHAINNTGILEATGLRAGTGGRIVLEGGNGKIVLQGKDKDNRTDISAGNVSIDGQLIEIKDINLNVDRNLTLRAAGRGGSTELKNTQVTAKGDMTVQGGRVLLHGGQNSRSNISAGNISIDGQSIEIKNINLTATQGDMTISAESTVKNIPVLVEGSDLKAKNDLRITAISKTDPGLKMGHTELINKGALTIIGSNLEAGHFMDVTGKTKNGSGMYGIGGITLHTVTLKAPWGKFTGETNSGYQSAYNLSSAGISLFNRVSFEGLFDLDAKTSGGAAAFFMTNAQVNLINGAKVDIQATGEAGNLRKNLGTVTFQRYNSVKGDGEFNINATANTSEATVYFYAGILEGDGKAKVSINARNTGSGDGILIHQGENPRATGISNGNLSGEAVTGDGVRFLGNWPLTAKNSTIKGTSQSGKGVSASDAKNVSLDHSTIRGSSENNTGVDFNGKAVSSVIRGTSGKGIGVNLRKGTVLGDDNSIIIGTGGPGGNGVVLPPGFSTGGNIIISRTAAVPVVPGNPVVPPDILLPYPPSSGDEIVPPPSDGDTGTQSVIQIPDTNVKRQYLTPDVLFGMVERKNNPEPTLEVCSEEGVCDPETTPAVSAAKDDIRTMERKEGALKVPFFLSGPFGPLS